MASFTPYSSTKQTPLSIGVLTSKVLISIALLVFSALSWADNSALDKQSIAINKSNFSLASMSSSDLETATAADKEQSQGLKTNTAGIADNSGINTPEFLDVDEAFQLTSNIEDGIATLIWVIAPEYYLYQHAFAIEADISNAQGDIEPLTLTKQAQFSQGIRKMDDYFGPVEVYYYQAIATFPLASISATADKANPSIAITVKYQGCADEGLCYPVQTKQLELSAAIAQLTTPAATPIPRNSRKPAVKLP